MPPCFFRPLDAAQVVEFVSLVLLLAGSWGVVDSLASLLARGNTLLVLFWYLSAGGAAAASALSRENELPNGASAHPACFPLPDAAAPRAAVRLPYDPYWAPFERLGDVCFL